MRLFTNLHPRKTNMTIEQTTCLIGHTSSTGCISSVSEFFGGVSFFEGNICSALKFGVFP